MQRGARMKREIAMLESSPPHGISCWAVDDKLDHLQAQLLGPESTPYHGGVFKLDIHIPDRYPFEPPKLKFLTPVYHPNIDNAGRICLDSLKMPPKGAWKPALNISTLLTSILLLLSEPNPEDPLMADISHEFKYSRSVYEEKAREWTKKYAKNSSAGASASTSVDDNKRQCSNDSENGPSDDQTASTSTKNASSSKRALSEDYTEPLKDSNKCAKT